MQEVAQNYPFVNLEEASYVEARKRFDAQRTLERTQILLDKIIDVIDSASGLSSDNTQAEQGVREDGDTITISAGALKYDDLIDAGETVVTRATDAIPCERRVMEGVELEFGLRFIKTEFVKLSDDNPQPRLGLVEIQGALCDADGVFADFPIARIFMDKDTGEPKLYYNFSSQIPGDSEDFAQVERIVEKALSPEVINTYPRTESISEKEHKDEHTLNEIAAAIALAREELLNYDPDYKYEIQQKLGPARVKARRIAGSSWKQNRRFSEYKGSIKYDRSHTMWIIDALKNTAAGRLEYKKLGITDEILERAKEILWY